MSNSLGSVTPHRDRWQVRAPGGKYLGLVSTEAEGRQMLQNYDLERRKISLTFGDYAEHILELRCKDPSFRGAHKELRRLRRIKDLELFNTPISDIDPPAARRFVLQAQELPNLNSGGKLSRASVSRLVALASVVMADAVNNNRIPANPFLGVTVRKNPEEVDYKASYLDLEEQRTIKTAQLSERDNYDRLVTLFAWGTGLRQGEQWNLLLRDIVTDGDNPRVVVRFGSEGKAPKSGKIRVVPLFGDSLFAIREWLKILTTWAPRNPEGLAFPKQNGKRRTVGKLNSRSNDFQTFLAKCGIQRDLRWHDLRHTFGCSLYQGLWGVKWTLEEIKEAMGHSTVLVTERYARMGGAMLMDKAKLMNAPQPAEIPQDVLQAAVFRALQQMANGVSGSVPGFVPSAISVPGANNGT